jgi:hypothetical protein
LVYLAIAILNEVQNYPKLWTTWKLNNIRHFSCFMFSFVLFLFLFCFACVYDCGNIRHRQIPCMFSCQFVKIYTYRNMVKYWLTFYLKLYTERHIEWIIIASHLMNLMFVYFSWWQYKDHFNWLPNCCCNILKNRKSGYKVIFMIAYNKTIAKCIL